MASHGVKIVTGFLIRIFLMIPGGYLSGIMGKSDGRLLKNRKALPRLFSFVFSAPLPP